MKTQYTLRAVALASVCLAPLAAYAQDDFDAGSAAPAAAKVAPVYDNEVELGIRTQNETSATFGRYNGNVNKGTFAFGGFTLRSRDDWKSGGTQYFEVVGRDLDFGSGNNQLGPDSSILFKVGNQGTWGVKGGYEAISYTTSTSFLSPYDTKGALMGAIPSNLANITLTGNNQLVQAALQNYNVGTRRDIGTIAGNYKLDDWTFTSGYRHEHKEGLIEQAMTAGSKVLFPEEVNYDTDRADAGVAFNSKKLQSVFNYSFSNFRDAHDVAYVQSLGAGATQWNMYAEPPSNSAHQISMNAGYTVSPMLRFNSTLAAGLQMQNDSNGQEGAPGRPNVTAHGVVSTYFADLAMIVKPLPRMDAKVEYTLDDRNDRSNKYGTAYVYGESSVGGTAGLQSSNFTSGMSWTKQTAKVEAGYRILDNTKLTAGVSYTDEQRDYAAVAHNHEVAEWAKVNSRFDDELDGMLGYKHSVRSSNALPASNASTVTLTDAQGVTYAYNAVPWYIENRTQDEVKVRGGYSPSDDINVGLNGKFTNNSYEEQYSSGIRDDFTLSIGPDLSYSPTKSVTTHLFYNFEQIFHNGQAIGANKVAGLYGNSVGQENIGANVTDNTTDTVHTVGASAEWKVNDQLKVSSEYNFVYGDTSYYIFDGVAGACTFNGIANSGTYCGLPDVNSILNSVKLKGEYEFIPGMTGILGYQFDYYRSNDWQSTSAYSTMGVNNDGGNGSSVLTSDSSGSYMIHTVRASVRMKF